MQRQEKENALYMNIEFKDFSEAFAFLTRVALLAESAQHHPRIVNERNKVELWLSTHDAGNIVTEKDRKLAKEISSLISNQ